MSNIGFVGLGIMGRPMCQNLLKAGHKLVVYDIVPALVERVAGFGAAPAASARDAAERSEIVITMLPDGPEVEQACSARMACWKARGPGSIMVDMSSISPLVAQKVGAACAGQGRALLGCAGERRRAESRRRNAGDHGGRRRGGLPRIGSGAAGDGIERHADRSR